MIKKETVLEIIDNFTYAANPEDPYPAYGTIAGMFDVLSILKEEISKLPNEDNWIPVSERLPEKSDWYAITVGKSRMVYTDYFDAKYIEWQDYCAEDIIAWHPLPDKYKGE